MSDEAPKPPPLPEKTKSNLSRALYWTAYVAIIAAFVGGTSLLTGLGLPYWAAVLIATSATGPATWYLGGSALNPDRAQDKDPFGRKFPTIIRHWLRARSLRSKQVEWRRPNQQDLPPAVVVTLQKHTGYDPEVAATVDGLLWVIAEYDDWDNLEPPMFALMAFDPAGQIQAADDFFRWPKGWTGPAGSSVGRKIRWVRRTR